MKLKLSVGVNNLQIILVYDTLCQCAILMHRLITESRLHFGTQFPLLCISASSVQNPDNFYRRIH
jgi:hypothetical protein